uniref:Uncharacterized protein n=1 Tax=Sphaerodactylus townsendi TaxID=933632 RepID=A0ACB8EFD4_9SAUR
MGVSEPNQGLPRFIAVGYVDDQLIAYYDSNIKRAVPGVPWMEKVVQYDPGYWDRESQVLQGHEAAFRANLEILQSRFNQSQDAKLSFSTLQPRPQSLMEATRPLCRTVAVERDA